MSVSTEQAIVDQPGQGPSVVRIGAWLVLAAGLFAVHAPAIAALLHLWDNSPMYSYGYLVPFVSAFLVWSQRKALARLTPAPSIGPGLAMLALWAVLLVGGRFATLMLAEQVALVVAVVAIVLLVRGWATLRTAWAGIAYLLLMVPIWDVFTEPLHPRFQQLSANIGVRMLDLVGVPAYREGTLIALPNLTLEVARACSGVNYLVAVLALGLPLGYLYLRAPWRRVVLLLSALAIAAVSNSLRVALIGILVYFDVGAPLHGPAHVLHGLFVSGIGHVTLFIGLSILMRSERREARQAKAAADLVAPSAETPAPPRIAPAPARLAPVLVLVAVFWATAGLAAWRQPSPIALTAALDRLPAVLGGWTADPYSTPAALPWWTGADAELRRTYRHGDRVTDVHVLYYESQRQSREVVTYRAADIHRGARVIDAPLDTQQLSRINVADPSQQDAPMLTVFWYELDGVVETAPSQVKLRTLWHALGRGRTNGAVICLRTADPGAASREPVLAELTTLAGQVHRGLTGSLPGRPEAPARRAAAEGAR
jgi:EpsI family protein